MVSTSGETARPRARTPQLASLAGAAAAALWVLLCIRWFDPAASWRPAVLDAIPPEALALPALLLALVWILARGAVLSGPRARAPVGGLVLVVALALLFRLPIVTRGAAAAVTPDGALSGIVALHVHDGTDHLVFVPHVPYSGSLKSHLTAPLCGIMDPARAFVLVSVLFYLAYVAGLYTLALSVAGPAAALLAGLYAAFSPPFLTRYSVSNDGNYVEVLAFGTWALWLAVRYAREPGPRTTLALVMGWLLGLAFWCHILAIIHLAAIATMVVLVSGVRALPPLLALGGGWGLGYTPGFLWNVSNEWMSFRYLLPGEARAGTPGMAALVSGLGDKLQAMVTDHWPVLLGYDVGYGALLDRALLTVAWVGVAAAVFATAATARRAWRERSWGLLALLVFAIFNVAIALVALPHVPGNPRYLLFLMSVLPVFLADALGAGRRRLLLGALVAVGAVASLAQLPGTFRRDAQWRQFVDELEAEPVHWCYTDFFLATPVNFLSGERVVCSAKLGPVTTEYFFGYRREVEAAPEAAYIAVNRTSARKLGRRLDELGVPYQERDWMKPVLIPARKVDPEELFPWREFPWR
jgi:hypothetical protein